MIEVRVYNIRSMSCPRQLLSLGPVSEVGNRATEGKEGEEAQLRLAIAHSRVLDWQRRRGLGGKTSFVYGEIGSE